MNTELNLYQNLHLFKCEKHHENYDVGDAKCCRKKRAYSQRLVLKTKGEICKGCPYNVKD